MAIFVDELSVLGIFTAVFIKCFLSITSTTLLCSCATAVTGILDVYDNDQLPDILFPLVYLTTIVSHLVLGFLLPIYYGTDATFLDNIAASTSAIMAVLASVLISAKTSSALSSNMNEASDMVARNCIVLRYVMASEEERDIWAYTMLCFLLLVLFIGCCWACSGA